MMCTFDQSTSSKKKYFANIIFWTPKIKIMNFRKKGPKIFNGYEILKKKHCKVTEIKMLISCVIMSFFASRQFQMTG